jgi:SAM-dependent methyltransferase
MEKKPPVVQFPSTVYKEAWKTFRARSDENEVTSQKILEFPFWRSENIGKTIRLLDIGCGDGLIIQELIYKMSINLGVNFEILTLIDPYLDWLQEANKIAVTLRNSGIVKDIKAINLNIEDSLAEISKEYDIILAIHVVYFLEPQILRKILQDLPSNVYFYVVMDAPGSVFSEIWRVTKPEYLERVEEARKLIESLDSSRYKLRQSEIISSVPNPLEMADCPVKKMILSMLSYSNYECLEDSAIEHINSEVSRNSWDGKLRCKSTCYEILKLSNS